MSKKIAFLVISLIVIGGSVACSSGQQVPEGEIANIAGDLYRFQYTGAYGVFLATPEGIILVDPVNTPTAQWLKGELAERFDVPVRYVIYTHHHWDHIEGGWEFKDTAEIVAHENMPEAMERGVSQTLAGASFDRNGDALLSREESTTGTTLQFDRLDRNGDGFMTGPELFAEIPPPDMVYKDRMTIELGGKTVELVYAGYASHAPDLTLVLFPEERTMFNADLVGIKDLPGGWGMFDRTPLADWIRSLETVETLDFDILVHAHIAEVGTKQDAVDYRQFFEDLVGVVSEGMAAGLTLDELKDTVTLEQYADWDGYQTHEFSGGQGIDIFGVPIVGEEAAKPNQGLRQVVQAAYMNLTAYPLESDD